MMFEASMRDIRFAARGLRRTPAFSAAAILTLAIGICATTAVFSVVYGVLFRPLPYPNGDRLVQVVQLPPSRGGGSPLRAGLTPDQVAEWRATSRSLEEIGYYSSIPLTLTEMAAPIRLNGASIAVPLFRALGVQPALGRTFTAEDEIQGNERVVVLSHDLWTRRFGGAPEILERPLALGGDSFRVIGVMPRGFGFPSLASPRMSLNADGELNDAPEFWVPMVKKERPAGPVAGGGGMTLVTTFALLRPGVTLEQATAEANTLMTARLNERWRIELVSARVEQTRTVRPVLLIFQGAVLFVLFIACANITNLLLARAAARTRELTVRLALGASHFQIARFAIAESLLISLLGGAAGSALAYVAITLVRKLPPYALPRLADVRMDATALALACAVSIGAGLAVGVWTARRTLQGARRIDDRTGGSTGSHRPSRTLVVAQTAAGVVLLASATLLLGSFVRLVTVERGFDASGVYMFRVSLGRGVAAPAQYAMLDSLLPELQATPGVRAVSATQYSPGGMAIGFTLRIDGVTVRNADVSFQAITPGFFETLRIPLRGRDFTAADRGERATTAIVNEAFVRRHLPGRDPVGQRIDFQQWSSLEIIGVSGDTRPGDPRQAPEPTILLPPQNSGGFAAPTIFVRSDRREFGLAAARAAVSRVDSRAVVFDATPLESLLARQTTTPKLYGFTATGFAVVAVALAALGLYGVLAYSVTARTREFGIRIAVGASSRRLIAGVMREAISTVLVGLALGLGAAFYLSRLLESLLFGVTPRDPWTFVLVAATFLAVAALACYVPARRATRVDPIRALRAE